MLILFCFLTQPHLNQLCHLIQIVKGPFGTVCKPECKTDISMAIQRHMGPLFEKDKTGEWSFIYSLTMQSDPTVFIFLISQLCHCLVAQSCPTVVTLWTVAHQAPLSMGFPRQEYWRGLPFLPPQDLPDPRIKPGFSALWADSSLTGPQGKPQFLSFILLKIKRIIIHVIATGISNSNMFFKLFFKDGFICLGCAQPAFLRVGLLQLQQGLLSSFGTQAFHCGGAQAIGRLWFNRCETLA